MQTLEFFYDFSSPFSYLASTQVRAIAQRTEAKFEPKPFVLGAVFKAVGSEPPARIAQKATNMFNDLTAWARDYNVPFQIADAFPINAIKPMRCVIAIADADASWKLAQALFGAFWGHNRDITQPDILAAVITECGLDAKEIIAATEQQAVKDRLRANTDDAITRGAFGAPTMIVNGQLFIGNDRLPFVERAARGEIVYGPTGELRKVVI